MSSELRYCENCGDIIQQQSVAPVNLAEKFFCEKCVAQGGAAPAANTSPPQSSSQNQAQAGDVLNAEPLNLFSKQTIEMKRSELEKLVEDSALELTDAPDTGGPETAETNPAPADNAAGEPRQSQEPGTASDQPPAEGSETPLKLVDPAVRDSGSQSPAQTARKIVFRCLYCRATLSIKPVRATSRLTCPYCSKAIYVTSSGRLHPRPPSSAVPKSAVPTEQASAPVPAGTEKTPEPPHAEKAKGGDSGRFGSPAARPEPAPPDPTKGTVSAIVEKVPETRGRGPSGGEQEPGKAHAATTAATAATAAGGGVVPPQLVTPQPLVIPAREAPPPAAVSPPPVAPSPASVIPTLAPLSPTAGEPSSGADELPLRAVDPAAARDALTTPKSEAGEDGLGNMFQLGTPGAKRAGASKQDAPPLTRDRSRKAPSFVKRFLMTTAWGFVLTLTLAAPLLLLGGVHHLAGAENAATRAERNSESVFESLGRIAQTGMVEVMKLLEGWR